MTPNFPQCEECSRLLLLAIISEESFSFVWKRELVEHIVKSHSNSTLLDVINEAIRRDGVV